MVLRFRAEGEPRGGERRGRGNVAWLHRNKRGMESGWWAQPTLLLPSGEFVRSLKLDSDT
jgi:hypothetical protein